MSRPKGSKNKKTLLSEALLDDKIAEQKVVIRKLDQELNKLLTAQENLREQLKTKKKELRTATRTLTVLEEKKEQADAVAVAAVQKKEIEKVVSTLVGSGKSAEEILAYLNQQ